MSIIKRAVSITAVGAAATGAILAAGAGTASAVTPISGQGYNGVVLTHEETVVAAQLGAGNLINLAYGDNWMVDLPANSVWNTGTGWTPVTGQQFLEEAASHPRGNVGLAVTDPAVHGKPFFAMSGGW
ncbi:hypothetical protein [Rhodococcus oryzae]|jgi:hypothetical protein|uniref:hypothetical protein n=1 Tax=Rhodococcus oryzae TaxID=2571143 RepID=UPI00379E2A44